MTITKNKNKETIYTINKRDSLITFKGHNYDINDNATARNLIYMLMDKCIQDDDLIEENYKEFIEFSRLSVTSPSLLTIDIGTSLAKLFSLIIFSRVFLLSI